MAQPSTIRENRSRITARESQPIARFDGFRISDPLLVGYARCTLPVELIGSKAPTWAALRCRLPSLLRLCGHAELLHQAHDTLASTRGASSVLQSTAIGYVWELMPTARKGVLTLLTKLTTPPSILFLSLTLAQS
jgi:hypothetical protein